jgi:hypothetical protein
MQLNRGSLLIRGRSAARGQGARQRRAPGWHTLSYLMRTGRAGDLLGYKAMPAVAGICGVGAPYCGRRRIPPYVREPGSFIYRPSSANGNETHQKRGRKSSQTQLL